MWSGASGDQGSQQHYGGGGQQWQAGCAWPEQQQQSGGQWNGDSWGNQGASAANGYWSGGGQATSSWSTGHPSSGSWTCGQAEGQGGASAWSGQGAGTGSTWAGGGSQEWSQHQGAHGSAHWPSQGGQGGQWQDSSEANQQWQQHNGNSPQGQWASQGDGAGAGSGSSAGTSWQETSGASQQWHVRNGHSRPEQGREARLFQNSSAAVGSGLWQQRGNWQESHQSQANWGAPPAPVYGSGARNALGAGGKAAGRVCTARPPAPKPHFDEGTQVQNAEEKGWVTIPVHGKVGGPEWVYAMLESEPPCLNLNGVDPSPSRVNRVKTNEDIDAFQQHGGQTIPGRTLLQGLFQSLLEGVRFPPSLVELSWRTREHQAGPKGTTGKPEMQLSSDLSKSNGEVEQFRIMHNLADVPCRQPPHFKRFPLRVEQLRSLGWMLAREGYVESKDDGDEKAEGSEQTLDVQTAGGEMEPFVVEWRQVVSCPRAWVNIDLKAKASHLIRGGILADRVGFGKTATTIGLIDATQHLPAPTVPDADKGSFIPAKGTLVIVPSNLLDQWSQEISKFVWDGRKLVSMNTGWKAGRSAEGCPLKVLAISTVSPLRLLTAGEMAEVDVVLCSYRLLFSKIYQERREDFSGGTSLFSLVQATRKVIEGTYNHEVRGKKEAPDSKSLVFPLLEMFYWRRVVFDEFHELESFQSAQQSVLQHMRAHSRWGLTGTPPIDNIAGVIFLSSLFRCDLPGRLPMEKVEVKGSRQKQEVPHMQFYEEDRLMRETAARFLDRFCRQNTAEVPHIALRQEVVLVRYTPAEQALYLGEAHDAPDVNWEDQSTMTDGKARLLEHLLKLCSHYQAGTSQASDAGAVAGAQAECEKVAASKSRKVTQERRTLARCARVIQILSQKLGKDKEDSDWRADLDSTISSMKSQGRPGVEEAVQEAEAAANESVEQRCAVLAGHRPRDEALNAFLAKCVDGEAGLGSLRHWQAFAYEQMTAKQARELLAGQAAEQTENLMIFSAALESEQYFAAVRRQLVDMWPQASNGNICQEVAEKASKDVAEMESSSLDKVQEKFKSDKSTEDEVALCEGRTSERSESSKIVKKFGSKLAVLVEKLQALRESDPSAKCILFVQFDDLKMQVGAALREGGIPTAQLKGSVSQRATIIRDWQDNPDSKIFVLLLSLAESASGTNLTAGSHVIFLHPMLASRPDRAAAQELQAIGRARRYGQKRDTLHVWRFVTGGTMEEAITACHLNRLLEYEAESRVRAETLKKEAAERAEREKKPAAKKQRRY